MKLRFFALSCALLFAAPLQAEYSQGVVHALDQLRNLPDLQGTPVIGGAAVGYGGSPHTFFVLFGSVNSLATDADLSAMLRDPSAVVRVMAAKCIVTAGNRKIDRKEIDVLLSDSAGLLVGPGGCIFEHMTVGKVVGKLKKDSDFLGSLK